MNKQKFTKSIIGLVVVGVIVLSYFQFTKNGLKEENIAFESATTLLSLPQGWGIGEQNQGNLLYKIE